MRRLSRLPSRIGLLGLIAFVTAAVVIVSGPVATAAAAAEKARVAPLPRSAPEAQGVSSKALLDFLDGAQATVDSLHSLMVLRHGKVIAEGWWKPYDAESPHELYSLSKSFTSTAIGLAVQEGKVSLDDSVLSFFPEDAPASPSDNLKAMRIRDLLCMSTGHQTEPPTSPTEMSAKSFLAHPVAFKPGTKFLYNTAATFMLSAILQKKTGQTVSEYLTPRLFEPLGIEHPTWQSNFQGINLGGYGLNVRTEHIARFGQLYLQKGQWNGKPLLTPEWVAMASARQTSNGSNPNSDWEQGYGFQFWRCRHGAFRGDGAFGQYCVVLPEQDTVIAITSGLRDMQAVLNLIWDKLLPGMHPRRLPRDKDAQAQLASRLEDLTLRPQTGSTAPSHVGNWAGQRYVFEPNDLNLEALTLTQYPTPSEVALTFRAGGLDQVVPCGKDTWKRSRLSLGKGSGIASGMGPDRPVAASGAWTKDDTFTAQLCFYETPFVATVTLRFEGQQVFVDTEYNVRFGASKLGTLVGRRP